MGWGGRKLGVRDGLVLEADTRLMEIKYDCCLHAYQHMAYELTFEENKNRTGSDQ